MKNPITPKDIEKKIQSGEKFPPEVIEAFNELIEKNYHEGEATILQKDVVELIAKKLNLDDNSKIYDNHWLDVEPFYRKAGWKVDYDKPAYCEDYEASFTFIK